MGWRNKAFSKDLHQQMYDRFHDMQSFSESKTNAKQDGSDKGKIFSRNTYQSYYKHASYFCKYVEENHPKCTTLDSAKRYVGEWLQTRVDQGLSAWTIQLEAKALGKLYGISPDDKDYFRPPERHREDIVRSRVDCVRDKHFSETNNDELIKFCRGTGLRRSELENLRGGDLATRDQIDAEVRRLEMKKDINAAEAKRLQTLKDAQIFSSQYYVHVVNGKGGRERYSPVIGPSETQIVARIQNTPAGEKVWQHVHTSADIHSYRADYATAIYKAYARPIDQIPYDKINRGTGQRYQSQVYACRKDEAGRKLDRAAMTACSKALGHNRVEVVANNYLRGL